MAFLTQQVSLPFWLVIVMIAGMIPLFIKAFSFFKFGGKSAEDELVIDSQMKSIAPLLEEEEGRKSKRPTEVKVIKLLAAKGDQGVLLRSIADTLQIDSNSVNHALKYLEGKNMVEVINSMGGDKYYLTKHGKNYCTKKGY